MGLDGYLLHRVLTRDLAEESGEYWTWPELRIDLPADYAPVLRELADAAGVAVDDLIAAVAHEAAVRTLRA